MKGTTILMRQYSGLTASIFVASCLLGSGLQAAESPFRRVLPGIMQTQGEDGARRQTSAWVVNLSASSASFEFGFMPLSNAAAPPAQLRTLAAGETLRLTNVLQDLFGLAEGEGALIVRGDQPFDLRGINANVTNPAGTSGQGVSPLPSSELLATDASGHSIWLANRSEAGRERQTDISAVLAVPNTTLTISVYDANAVLRGIEVVSSKEPVIWRASVSQFLPDPEIPIGRVKFAVTAGEATGWLSVSDRAGSKGVVNQPERVAAAVPEGADLLLNGVTASTTLRLFNPNETEQSISIEALGFPGEPVSIRRIIVAPNGLLEVPNILSGDGYAVPEGSVGALRIRAALPFLASGQGLPIAVPYETGFSTPVRPMTLVGLNDSGSPEGARSRVALLSGPRRSIGLLRLRNSQGQSIATSPIRLEANEYQGQAIGSWFSGTEIPTDARVDIVLQEGSLHSYAEIVDNLTQSRVLVASSSVPVEPPPAAIATRLIFSALPASVTAGAPFTATVRALRTDNSLDTSYNASIELRASGPGGFPAPVEQRAVGGVATFTDLRLSAAGTYTLSAQATGLESAVSQPLAVAAVPPPTVTVIRTGRFAGQNGYIAEGTLQIERAPSGAETLKLDRSFRVSAGAGAISVWLARSSGPLNPSNSLRVGTINRVFSGEFTFPIPSSGSSGFTHVIVYCDPFRINFGAAALTTP